MTVLQGNQGASTITTTVSGGFNNADRAVGYRCAYGNDRKLQPNIDSSARFRHLDHDDYGRVRNRSWDLSDHGHR